MDDLSRESQFRYEFSESENVVFRGLARAMQWAGMLILFFAALVVSTGFYLFSHASEHGAGLSGGFVVALVLYFAFLLAMALPTLKSSRSFRLVDTTEGNDIRHLMNALGSLEQICLVYITANIVVIAAVLVIPSIW